MEAKKIARQQLSGIAVSSLMRPSKGMRDDIVRQGGVPKNHSKDNVKHIRQLESSLKEKKKAQEEEARTRKPFRLREFENVSSRVFSTTSSLRGTPASSVAPSGYSTPAAVLSAHSSSHDKIARSPNKSASPVSPSASEYRDEDVDSPQQQQQQQQQQHESSPLESDTVIDMETYRRAIGGLVVTDTTDESKEEKDPESQQQEDDCHSEYSDRPSSVGGLVAAASSGKALNYIKMNMERIQAKRAKAAEEANALNRKTRLGNLPKYLVDRKAQWAKVEEEKQAALYNNGCPQGMKLMQPEKQAELLTSLKENHAKFLKELNSLPLRVDHSPHLRKLKADIEAKLRDIEKYMDLISKPKVYIDINAAE